MIKFLSLFILFLSTLNQAIAQESMTHTQMLAHCEAKWGSRVSAVAQCVTNLRLAQAEATDVAIVARLDEGEERDGEILERLDTLTESVDRLVTSASQSTPTATSGAQARPIPSGVTYTRTGGAAWAPVAQPTVVSIHNIGGMAPDTLHITSLEHPTARKTCGGEGATLVVFYDHGVPVSNVFAPAGVPTGFIEVYYDKQNDGIPDGTVMALDLESQTDVWITWGQANDLTIRYLRPGAQIAVEGLPLQTVYHPTQRNEASASGAIACDRDDNARRGGHQAIPAYSLCRMW
ncbi:hypothetical protein HY626_03655 [Candidatus Uhrbacteria bacterium]|nr:hypothetical protein [Candidatus Uhrbacteria bacterium]